MRRIPRAHAVAAFLVLAAACTGGDGGPAGDPEPEATGGSGGAGGRTTGGSGGQKVSPDAGGAMSGTSGTPGSGGRVGGAGGGTDAGPPDTGGTGAGGAPATDAGGDGGSSVVVTDPGKEGDGDTSMNGPYVLPPEATLQPGVTAGKMTPVMVGGKIFAARMAQVYTPVAYVAGTPAPFMVIQDGNSYINNFKLNTVLDNMIAKHQLPVMICIFVPNGGAGARSLEYDTLDDKYTRFVLEEILPVVEKDLPIKLTTDPEGRAAGGHSSGGIAAFTMGWHRPDQFHRILSNSGSFVGIRGGNKYPGMVMMEAQKPLRVFLSVGTKDQQSPQWQKANYAMAAALAAKEYHYRFVTLNNATHAQNYPASIMPETLLWLWRGYPIAGK